MDQWLPFWEIAFGTATLIVSLMLHGMGMFLIQRMNQGYRKMPPLHWRREMAFSLLIFLMLCTHLVEMLLWAEALVLMSAMAVFRDAYYYVAVTYTTLGYAENTLPHQWRILAPMMAMSGLFAFGWTTSVFFSIVGGGGVAAPDEPPRPSSGKRATGSAEGKRA